MAAIVNKLEQALAGSACEENSGFCPEDVCSFCITGTNPRYQGIYQCVTCIKARRKHSPGSKDSSSCFCIGCSKVCHRGHKVELVGYSNGFCDCGAAGCSLNALTASKHQVPRTAAESNWCLTGNRMPFSAHLFGMSPSSGHDFNTIMSGLREECMAIVCESKETFWVGADWEFSSTTAASSDKTKCRCQLEDLALMVFRYHAEHARSDSSSSGSSVTGAEWWIQIKSLDSGAAEDRQASGDGSAVPQTQNADPTIELHYDKDEGVAEDWGVGVYPSLSTVTYLSASTPSARYLPQQATVVYSNTTEDEVGNPISDCYLSFPKVGKHVCFDGSLLHGAPSNKALARWEWEFNGEGSKGSDGDESSSSSEPVTSKAVGGVHERFRFTFLVNVWLNHHPATVEPLPDVVLGRIQALEKPVSEESVPPHILVVDCLSLAPADADAIVRVTVADEEALKPDTYELKSDEDEEEEEEEEGAGIMERIRDDFQVLYIPFIPADEDQDGGAEKGDDEDASDGECGLSLRMILPPADSARGDRDKNVRRDCFHISYEDECAAVLEYI